MLSTIRHDEVFDAKNNNQKISIIGAGAIGSRVFAALAELGLTEIATYDFDNVEAHNLANQIYNTEDIGHPKVVALANWCDRKLGVDFVEGMSFHETRVDKDTPIAGSVFLLVDSMEARRQIFEENIQGNPEVYRVIDVRMASTHGNVFTFNPHTQGQQWVDTLINDDDAEVSACGSSLTVGTTASILSNLAVWQYMHAKTNKEAVDDIVNVFLKPLVVSTQNWEK